MVVSISVRRCYLLGFQLLFRCSWWGLAHSAKVCCGPRLYWLHRLWGWLQRFGRLGTFSNGFELF